jgi:hypothetical protein
MKTNVWHVYYELLEKKLWGPWYPLTGILLLGVVPLLSKAARFPKYGRDELMKLSGIVLLLVSAFCAGVARADTVVMKTLEVIEGKILKQNADFLELQVEFGTMRVPTDKILRIEADTPEILAQREARAAAIKEQDAKAQAEGKVKYKGKWVTPDEKSADEAKIAAAKKKRDDERAAAKKKAEEEVAARKKKEEAELQQQKALEAQQLIQEQQAQKIRDQQYRNSPYKNAINQFNNGNLQQTLRSNGF